MSWPDPREELRRVLAPIVLEEGDARIRFQNQEMLLYFVTDYRFAVPAIRRLYGRDSRFAHRLYVSYYITSPSSDEMARSARKASTAKQALATIAQRAGSLPSYKEAEEVLSIEEARAGAETEKNVTKMLGSVHRPPDHNKNSRRGCHRDRVRSCARPGSSSCLPGGWPWTCGARSCPWASASIYMKNATCFPVISLP